MTRVLIVDDSPTETFKMSEMLQKSGFEVITAENGEKGVAMAREHRPDVVLMDIVMPGMNGFQATRQLGQDERTRAIPVIIVTTKDQETDRLWGKRQGAKGYLTKPVDASVLVETIKSVMAAA